jgi:hypothetical protein
MFTELMEASEPRKAVAAPSKRQPAKPSPPPPPAPPRQPDDLLPGDLEDLSTAGYNSHSYRFTEAEIRWLRRFCLRASERLDRQISHNTLIRVLLRLADDEWRGNPRSNRILQMLGRLRD